MFLTNCSWLYSCFLCKYCYYEELFKNHYCTKFETQEIYDTERNKQREINNPCICIFYEDRIYDYYNSKTINIL